MFIRFSRPKGKPVLTCVRDDGSTIYAKPRQGEFFARHDLMHYAVESTLGLRQSFFGLIAAGWSIDTFGQPGATAKLPDEAKLTEFIVGQLAQEAAFEAPTSADDFNSVLATTVAQTGRGATMAPRSLSEDELSRIRELFARLLARYLALGPGESLEVAFPA